MIKVPQVNGLILCEGILVEKASATFSLDGVFLVREFKTFPTPTFSFAVYASLFDGRGEGEMSLTCTQLEEEKDIHYHRRWYGFSRSVQTVHYIQKMEKLFFRKAGRHAFTLSFNKVPLTVRYLDVKEIRR